LWWRRRDLIHDSSEKLVNSKAWWRVKDYSTLLNLFNSRNPNNPMKRLSKLTAFTLLLLLFSCEKEVVEVSETASVVIPQTSINAVYNVAGGLNAYTAYSPSTITLSGGCGSYVGGVIRTRVTAQSGSNFTIQISKKDSSVFSLGGTARVKSGSVCGGLSGSALYNAGSRSVSISINVAAILAQGLMHFYPVLESSNGARYFAEPIVIYTIPLYAAAPYYNGKFLTTVDGVSLYASSSTLLSSTSIYQCTDWCKRYYSQVYGMTIGGWGNANVWFNNTSGILTKYANGTSAPRIGDVLCLSGGSSGNGHVAIITEVSANQIKMSNQNGGTGLFYPIGWTLSRSGNTVSSPSGFTVQGWMRKP
jgi:surface antigen